MAGASGCSTLGRRDPDKTSPASEKIAQVSIRKATSDSSGAIAAREGAKLEPSKALPKKEAAQACLAVARSLEAEGHYTQAVAQFELARAYDSGLSNLSRRLAVLHSRLGNTDKAKIEFESCLKTSPNDADLLNDVAYFYLRQGDAPKAESYLRQAVLLDSKLDKAWVNLGLALAEQGRREESLEAFGKSVSPAVAHANLGVVLLRKGLRDEAEATIRQAIALDPSLQQARLALRYLEQGSSSASALETPRPALATE